MHFQEIETKYRADKITLSEFTAIIEPAEEGGYWAYCLEVEGANGQGETVDEVIDSRRCHRADAGSGP